MKVTGKKPQVLDENSQTNEVGKPKPNSRLPISNRPCNWRKLMPPTIRPPGTGGKNKKDKK